MPKQRADGVLETSITTGTGSYALLGGVAGYRAMSAIPSIADGDTLEVYVEGVDGSGVPDGSGYEHGVYTWRTGNTLERTRIKSSSNGGAAVAWSSGTRRIGLTLLASEYNPGVPLGALIALAYNTNTVTLGDMVFQKANTSVAWTAPTHADPTLLPGYWTTYGAQKSVALGDFGSGAVQPTLMAGNGAGTVCAVGTGGILTTTDNGANWLTLQGNFYSVVFANSKFVAVGDNGLVAYSSDGYAWTFIHAVNKTTSWRFVIWDAVNSLFLAAGIAGAATTSSIMTSPDGVTWTSRVTSASGSGYNKIALGGIYQVAVGTGKSILTAQNGTAWTTRTVTGGGATQNFVDVAYSGSGWAAVGTFATGNYAYIGTANPTGTWTAGNLGTLSLAINCITVFNSLFIVGVASATAASNIQTAPAIDPSTWTARNSACAVAITALGSDGATLIVLGASVNSGSSSTDGTTYTSRALSASSGGAIGSGPMAGLTYLNGVMVQTNTYTGSGTNVSTISMGAVPAVAGVYADLSISGVSGSDSYTYGAAYGAGVYVVVGARLGITTSTNMTTFAQQNWLSALAPNSIECDGTNFAVGVSGAAAGSIWYSADGKQWKRKNVVSGGGATIARYGGGTWVCANSTGTTSNSVSTASTPGGTWTAQTTGIAAPYDIRWTGTRWILTNNSTTVQRSLDAVTWVNSGTTLAFAPSAISISRILFDNGIICIPDTGSLAYFSNDDGATFTRLSGAALGSNDNVGITFTYTGTGYIYGNRYGSAYSTNGVTGWSSNAATLLATCPVATASNQMPAYFRIGTRVFALIFSGPSAWTPDFAYSDDNLTTWYGGNWSSAAPTIGVVVSSNRDQGVLVSNGYLYVIIGTIQISVGPASPIVPTSVYIYGGSSNAPQPGTGARHNWYGRVK